MKTILSLFLFVTLSFAAKSQSLCRYYLDMSQSYTAQKDFEKAHFYVNKALKMYPDTARCYLMRGGAYYFSGNLDEAYIDFDRFIQMEPNDPEGYQWRGVVLSDSRVYDEAETDFIKCLELEPEDEFIKYKLSEAYLFQDKYDLAEKGFRELLELDPNWTSCYNLLGLLYEDKKDYKLSVEYFSKGIEKDATYVSFYYNRARVNIELGNQDEACEDYRIALNLGAEDSQIWMDVNNCSGIKGLIESDIAYDKQELFKGKKDKGTTIEVTADYLPMRRHARYTYTSTENGKIDTAAMAVLYDDPHSNEYHFDLWNDVYTDLRALYFTILNTNDFRSTDSSLQLLMYANNSEDVPINLFPREFKLGQKVTVENTWNPEANYEMKQADLSLEEISSFQMPNGETKNCVKLRFETKGNNGRDRLSYVWFVKDFGVVKWRNSEGEVWEIIRYAVPDYGTFPKEEQKFLNPPPQVITTD